MSLWGGRFSSSADAGAFKLNASIDFDKRMALQDIRGSIAWASALVPVGILKPEEAWKIQKGLEQIEEEFEAGRFEFIPSDEDIHTAVERRLRETVGPLAGKLHTGRSRNDQVATDFRLWLLNHLPLVSAALAQLQSALIFRAKTDLEMPMPGYTHLQRAQPVLLGHWWLSHFWPLARDQERLVQLADRVSVLPLGCGALAGAPFPVDREKLADDLGFKRPAPNSLDAVSDRDFAAEFLFAASLIGVHLSKLAESMVLFTSTEFGYFELSDAYATGSSLMPQKKNPDHFELARGKAGTLLGYLTGLMATLKGLPSTYDKDLQEDKLPVFAAVDTLLGLLPVMAGALRTLQVNGEKMEKAISPGMLATDLADYLVAKGVPFREAHEYAGVVVRMGIDRGVSIDKLSPDDYQSIHEAFEPDVFEVFNPMASINRRSAIGGTAVAAVKKQLTLAKAVMKGEEI